MKLRYPQHPGTGRGVSMCPPFRVRGLTVYLSRWLMILQILNQSVKTPHIGRASARARAGSLEGDVNISNRQLRLTYLLWHASSQCYSSGGLFVRLMSSSREDQRRELGVGDQFSFRTQLPSCVISR
ncbi:hypothetical protein E2C01_014275 [Portunus trituberculatus]|uniref:Uncharacterized protein n=1 Tax=Portunus trituberculatus TaxID=210409 RepID=A0A5B7DJK1_PORTR|nr:hypothetical protein [Portunus trituberculatus]